MNMQSSKLALVAAAFLGNLLVAVTPAQATLIGDTITATGLGLTPATATIGAGIEFTGIGGFINFDFGASTLTLTPLPTIAGVGWTLQGNYVFGGFDSTITGLSILSNTGFTGDLASGAFSFTADSITLGMLNGLAAGEVAPVLVFDIQTAIQTVPVPEPATLALLGLGLAGLGFSRRRKSVQA